MRAAPLIALACGVAVFAIAIVPRAPVLAEPQLFTEALDGPYRDVTLWARRTDPDALFVVPPYMKSFRLMSRRAIVVDSRSPPLFAGELVAWYRRMCALVGVDAARSKRDIEALYDRMTATELESSAQRFDAQYIVIDKQRSAARLASVPAFEDWRVVVYAVSPARPGS